MSDLLDAIEAFARSQPGKAAFSWIDDAGEVAQALRYADIALQSSRLASHLLKLPSIKQGDRVLLVYQPSLQFIVAFLACLKAGLVAVPTFPPDPAKLNKDLQIFSVIVSSCGAKVALTSSTYSLATKVAAVKNTLPMLFDSNSSTPAWPELAWIVTDSILSDGSIKEPFAKPAALNDVAFLQYTSGSTSEPKGVIITQAALGHNLGLIIAGLKAKDDTVVVSWLPQYHDMGLIGSYLGVLFCGGSGYYLSPVSFIRNPVLWVVCMSRYHATHIQAPNFAYALTARKFLAHMQRVASASQRGGGSSSSSSTMTIDSTFDLSSVRHMINAAEPVEASTIDLFYAVFSKYGLQQGVIYPTYGLAEHCVYVCSNGKERLVLDKVALEKDRIVRQVSSDAASSGSDGGVSTVVVLGCGRPSDSDSLDLRIIDSEGHTPLPEGRVGEIWLKSQSLAAGYWGLAEKSKEDFNACLSQDLGEGSILGGGEGGFLRTGDLGFIHNGEVFVCGRLKDLIIIRGRNHYPQDIERTAESVAPTTDGLDDAGLRGGCSAAFSVSVAGQEMLIYAAECTTSKLSGGLSRILLDKLKSQISRVHGVTPAAILLLEPRSIPKTTSGKIARQWARKAYLEGTLKVIDSWSSVDAQGNEGLDASAAPSQGLLGSVERDGDAIDPTGQPLDFVVASLQRAVAQCLEQSSADAIATDVPLVNLGMDSLKSVQLQAVLEKKFTVPLPEELMFEPDATLRTIAAALVAGGVLQPRPLMLNMWDVAQAVRKLSEKTPSGKSPPAGPLPNVWFRERQRRADVDSHKFPDGCATPRAPYTASDASFVAWGWFILRYGEVSLVVITSLICVFGMLVAPTQALGIAVTVVAVSIGCVSLANLQGLLASFGSSTLRRSVMFESFVRHFSMRVITERTLDLSSTPTVIALAPGASHDQIAMAQTLLVMLSEFFLGKQMTAVAADAGPDIQKALANRKHSVCVGFVRQRRGQLASDELVDSMALPRSGDFIVACLETGAQLVPCYCFGSTDASSPSRADARAPLLFVFGRPIQCPQVKAPSAELVHEYRETYLREIRRLFDAYKNCLLPSTKDIKLEIKR